jgi:MFS family permease
VLITGWTGDWRTAWYAGAGMVMLVGLPVILSLIRVEREPQSHEMKMARARTARDWTRAEVIRDPVLYLLLAGVLAPPFIGTVIFFHQGYLIALRGYDPLVFAAAFPVMSVMTILFGFICGHMVDRYGALKLLPFFLLPLAVASAAVALITPVWGVYVFMALLGISTGFTFTLLGALWPEVYGVANLGGIRAIVVAAMVLATAAGPGITGALIDWGIALPTQLLWLSGWCVVGCFLLAHAARRVRLREGGAAALVAAAP